MKPESLHPNPAPAHSRLIFWLRILLLALAAVFFCLHFLHLNADFPNNSPWTDWSKYTDEGWYGDAAIRHYFFGHWYFPGDFNPAVALPVWPAIEFLVFHFTGVTPAAARALTLCIFALTLFVFYRLIERFSQTAGPAQAPSLAAPLAVLLLCVSPFFYVFERMAILEPPLIAFTALAMLIASSLRPFSFRIFSPSYRKRPLPPSTHTVSYPSAGPAVGITTHYARHTWSSWLCAVGPSIALGLILPVMILTKTTAIFLMPAVMYMLWARAGYRLRTALRLAIIPTIIAAVIWLSYVIFFVRPHYLADYQYLFSANGYTGIELEPYSKVILNTITDGAWMGHVLYPLFFVTFALALFWRPRLFHNPLFPALLLWTGGYFAFLAYHNNLQPRYYLVAAAPITVLVALGIDTFRQAETLRARVLFGIAATVATLSILIPDAVTQIGFIEHPEYTFQAAANGIKRIVEADPTHSRLILSISGSDITLFTGLPSIDDDFGTLDLDERAKAYRPGWYAAWNELDDDKMDALTPLFHVERVAAFPAMDDSERNLLILYRLDPTIQTPPTHTHKPRIPKPLITKLGQQPDTQQLEH